MSTRTFFISLVIASVLGSVFTVLALRLTQRPAPAYESFEQNQQVRLSRLLSETDVVIPEGLNFMVAAEATLPAVVHIKTSYGTHRKSGEDLFKNFFGDGEGFHGKRGFGIPREASGSGVIISDDGYIVTNNHVIDEAAEIEVVLSDKRSYRGQLIGADPATDLALVKIDSENLPFARYGNSDDLRIGEWVLAVGNPLELTSTVTAGIVSAKARNINILRTADNSAIESFIQTDAAVNPGNSGGALVNLKGELIGINTAIATTTGSYAGYSFAVPVMLVKKIMDDLLRYGQVQRAVLGVRIIEVTADFAREKGIRDVRGVYISSVGDQSAAQEADMEAGDIVLAVNDVPVNTPSELQEIVARYRPGDEVIVDYVRKGEPRTANATLKSLENTRLTAAPPVPSSLRIEKIGAVLQQLSPDEQRTLGLTGGVKVMELLPGKFKEEGIRQGFVITTIDKQAITEPTQVETLAEESEGALLIEGLYPDGKRAYYAIGW